MNIITMKAWQVARCKSSPELVSVKVPQPGPDEVLVRIHACGVNFADLLMAAGEYQDKPLFPYIMGMECAGEIVALGENVAQFSQGDRVACYISSGGMAEYVCLCASRIIFIPDTMPYDVAAAFQISYGTSYLALNHLANLRPEETVYISGAAGGVGLTAVELAKKMGARVVALARGAQKREVLKDVGADVVIESESPDLTEVLRSVGRSDVVYDTVGGELFHAMLRSTNQGARIVSVGYASGQVPKVALNYLLVKNISIMGFWLGGYLNFSPDVLQSSFKSLVEWYENGTLVPHRPKVLPMNDLLKALDMLRKRQAVGKIVIRIIE